MSEREILRHMEAQVISKHIKVKIELVTYAHIKLIKTRLAPFSNKQRPLQIMTTYTLQQIPNSIKSGMEITTYSPSDFN